MRLVLLVNILFLLVAFRVNGQKSNLGDTVLIDTNQIEEIKADCYKTPSRESAIYYTRQDFDHDYDKNCHPEINFKQKTLLAFSVTTGGCKMPPYKIRIKIIHYEIIVRIEFIHPSKDDCAMAIFKPFFITIPKIAGGYTSANTLVLDVMDK